MYFSSVSQSSIDWPLPQLVVNCCSASWIRAFKSKELKHDLQLRGSLTNNEQRWFFLGSAVPQHLNLYAFRKICSPCFSTNCCEDCLSCSQPFTIGFVLSLDDEQSGSTRLLKWFHETFFLLLNMHSVMVCISQSSECYQHNCKDWWYCFQWVIDTWRFTNQTSPVVTTIEYLYCNCSQSLIALTDLY